MERPPQEGSGGLCQMDTRMRVLNLTSINQD
jgi:hypothetical protein